MFSKCCRCDERNANIYDPDTDDMYCYECHLEKREEEECYCDEEKAIICVAHCD